MRATIHPKASYQCSRVYSQYAGQVAYCSLSSASEVSLIFTTHYIQCVMLKIEQTVIFCNDITPLP